MFHICSHFAKRVKWSLREQVASGASPGRVPISTWRPVGVDGPKWR
jgi:hypothetical protein